MTEFTGTTIIKTEEFERLRDIEKRFDEFLDNKDAIIIQQGHYHTLGFYGQYARIINPDEAMKQVTDYSKRIEEKLQKLMDKKVPVLNYPGTKVREL